jgi:hypothetical protein
MVKRRVWRHQRGSQNPYIEDEQTTQWSKGLRYKDSDYPFGVFKLLFWPLCCLFIFDIWILTTPLVSSNSSFDHCVVCSSSIYGFWLPLWCLQTLLLTIVLSVPLRYNDSGSLFGVLKLVFWPLCCLFVFDIKILTIPLVSSNSSFDHYVVEQTTQWSKEEVEDTKGVVRIVISKSNRQHNGQEKSLKTPQG